jgi:cbb3-type cytochrome oxidase subunit 3
MGFTSFLIDYFPLYNKFRDVKVILVLVNFAFPVLAIMAIKHVINGNFSKDQFKKAFKYSLYIVGGIALLFTLFPGIFDNFSAQADTRYPNELVEALRHDRKAILRADAFRSLVFVLLAAGIVWFLYTKKLKRNAAIVLLGVLFLFDLWPVDKRYLNDDNFVSKREVKQPFKANRADQFILRDKEENFRVLDLTVDPFRSARASYFHNSIGGYHGAKLQRYQELIEYYIHPSIQNLAGVLKKGSTREKVDSVLKKQDVLNMLNTKYIIINPDAPPLLNAHKYGNAWFVNDHILVDSPDEAMNKIGEVNLANKAVINKKYNEYLEGKQFQKDTTAIISLKSYAPNHLIYNSKSQKEQLAVFSEIYYPHGWEVYIDGDPAPHFRADYVLRSMVIPEGNHKIEFKFKPKPYYVGSDVSLVSSLLLLLIFIGAIVWELKNQRKEDINNTALESKESAANQK